MLLYNITHTGVILFKLLLPFKSQLLMLCPLMNLARHILIKLGASLEVPLSFVYMPLTAIILLYY